MAKQVSANARLTKADLANLRAKTSKRAPIATVLAGVLLLVFLLVVVFVLPAHLPRIMIYVLAAANAALALLLPYFASKEFGQGKLVRKLPLLGQMDLGLLGGIVLAAATVGWWLSPLSPKSVGIPSADEIAQSLSEEITLAVLTTPDLVLAVVEPPTPPPHAARLAEQIPSEAPAFTRLFKAVAERRYAEALLLADRAETEGGDPLKLALARGQIEVYSGNYSKATAHFEKAANEQPDVLSLGQLAVAHALAGNVERAYATAHKLLEGARSGSVSGDNAVAVALNIKAAVALSSGRFSEAVSLSEESQIAWEMAQDSAHKAASRNNQAVVYAMLPKKFAGAATQFDAALALWGKLYGFESAHAQMCRHNLAVLSLASGKFREAETQFENSLEAIRKIFGDRSAAVGIACAPAARLQIWAGRFAKAFDLLEQGQKTVGQSPLVELAVDGVRGTLLSAQGRYGEAAGALAKARSNARSLLEDQHPFAADLNIRWGEINLLRERDADTQQVCQDAIQSLDEHLVAKHPLSAQANNVLGWLAIRQDKKPEAKAYFDLARAIGDANRNETGVSLQTGIALRGLGRTQSKRGWRDAIALLRAAVKVEVEALGILLVGSDEVEHVETTRTADYWYDQAVFFTAYGDRSERDQAVELFNQVLALQKQLLPPAHPQLAETYSAYAKLLEKLDKKAEAEQMQQQADQIRKALEGGSEK